MQAWIYIDIFDTQYSYRLTGQTETLTNQIFKRLFKILTEEKFRIHQDKCIQNWDSTQKQPIDSDEDEERRMKKKQTLQILGVSNTYLILIANETEIRFQDSTIKEVCISY